MAVLGLLSIIQVAFLPGYLIVRALDLDGRILRTLFLSFALSLVVNHFLVVGLVLLGIYRPGPMYAIFCGELLLLLRRGSVWTQVSIADSIDALGRRWRRLVRPRGDSSRVSSVFRFAWTVAALVLISGFAFDGIRRLGRIFVEWDAVVSWNCWAIESAKNRLPHFTGMYPQLLPCNLSITYVFLQTTEVWFFAKGFLFLFCLALLIAMFDLADETESFGYVPGIVACYWLFVALLRYRFLSSGYADVPLAMFSFACVYAVLLARYAKDSAVRWKFVLLGAVFGVGAALTKQIGLYWIAAYPILVWLLVFRTPASNLRASWLRPVTLTFLILALAAPWYAYKQVEFKQGRDSSNTELLVTQFHGGRTPIERISHGIDQLNEALLPLGLALLGVALAAALFDPVHRWIVLVGVVPLVAIWLPLFSYDLRNLAIAIPLAAMAAGHGAMILFELLVACVKRLWRIRLVAFLSPMISRSEPTRH